MSTPTEGELAILGVLWREGPATVRTVNERLNEASERPIGYTTTLKLMQLMVGKGLVFRDTSQRSHLYAAAVAREKTQRKLLGRFIDATFGGSSKDLVLSALGQSDPSAEELAEIRRLIEQLENDRTDD
jgi:predicted transcriptional regulator